MLNQDPKKIDFATLPINEVIKGNALDSYFTLLLYEALAKEINPNFQEFHDLVLSPLIPYFAEQTREGIPVDPEKLNNLSLQLQIKKSIAKQDIFNCEIYTDGVHNINSNKDLASVLYCSPDYEAVEGSINLHWPETTDKGAPSTNSESLKFLLSEINTELAKRNNFS